MPQDVRDLPLIRKSGRYEVRRGMTDDGTEHTVVWDGRNHIDITQGLSLRIAKQWLTEYAEQQKAESAR